MSPRTPRTRQHARLAAVFHKRLEHDLAPWRSRPDDTFAAPVIGSPGHVKKAHLFTRRDWWPADLTLPITVGEVLDLVDVATPGWPDEMAAEVRRCAEALVVPPLLDAVLARRAVAERWPWPADGFSRPGDPWWLFRMMAIAELRRALLSSGDLNRRWAYGPVEDGMVWPYWPGEAAPLDVARWARSELDRHLGGKPTALELAEHAPWGGTESPEGDYWPGGGLALLYLAERELRPRAPTMALLPVEPPTVRLVTSMAGAHPSVLNRRATLTREPHGGEPIELLFSWPEQGDEDTQLRLPLTPPGAGVLTAVSCRFGPAAVRDVLALYLFTWAARAAAKEPIWWWPDEHLALCGLDDQTGRRRRLHTLWEDLHTATLTAKYEHGRPLTGPVVARLATDGAATELRFHPALYAGVTREDGRRGSYYWPIPVDLLRLAADRSAGKVHVLAALLGAQWRRVWDPDNPGDTVARVGAKRLADGMTLDRTRGHERRAGETLETSLDAAVSCGLVERYEVERGRLSDLSAMLRIWPVATGKIERPPWIPATGGDLVRWMDTERLTAAAVGKLLGENPTTVRQWRSRYRNRPLPAGARRALRLHLWGPSE
jgi:hypothetical protein